MLLISDHWELRPRGKEGRKSYRNGGQFYSRNAQRSKKKNNCSNTKVNL